MAALHLFRLLRPKQWVKNLFVFAPLLFAGRFSEPHSVFAAVLAFVIFSVAAACVYILNDLMDIEDDRKHPVKSKTRPLATGDVTKRVALVALGVLTLVLASSFFILPDLLLPVAGYVGVNVVYSFFARSVPVLDIFVIAFGFVLRVVGGALVIHEPLSAWMFVTTLCLALYLAAMKRRHELRIVGAGSRSSLGAYSAAVVERFAEISATAAFVCYVIFVVTVKVDLVYTIPVVAFGLFRYWFIAERLKTAESPTEAMLKDWPLVAAVALWVLICGGVLLLAGH